MSLENGFPTTAELLAAVNTVEANFGDYPDLTEARDSLEEILKLGKDAVLIAQRTWKIIQEITRIIPADANEDLMGEHSGCWYVTRDDERGWILYNGEIEAEADPELPEYSWFQILKELPALINSIRKAMRDYHAEELKLIEAVRKACE